MWLGNVDHNTQHTEGNRFTKPFTAGKMLPRAVSTASSSSPIVCHQLCKCITPNLQHNQQSVVVVLRQQPARRVLVRQSVRHGPTLSTKGRDSDRRREEEEEETKVSRLPSTMLVRSVVAKLFRAASYRQPIISRFFVAVCAREHLCLSTFRFHKCTYGAFGKCSAT